MNYKRSNIVLDIREFEAIFRELFIPLCHFANKFLKDEDISKELVHDVFVRVWEQHEKLHLNIPLKSYLYTSVRNRSLNYLRDHEKFIQSDISELKEISKDNITDTDVLELEELNTKIQQALQELPEKTAEVFRMSRFEGMKYKDIANQLKISLKTVEAHMSKALKILRESLKDYLYILIVCLLTEIF